MEGNTELSSSKAYRFPIIVAIVMGIILFLPAGSLRYWEGWIYWSVTFAITIFITTYFLKKDPELLARRNQFKEKEKPKGFMRIFPLFLLATFLIPGLDYRFHWSDVPVGIIIASNAVIFLSYVLFFLVFKQNSYASTIIQVDKEQQVISTGLYAVVRHPMYTGMLLTFLFTPLALGSYWALIPSLLHIPWIILRIRGEEKLLLQDLPGYRDYCLKTRYRLIPSIW